MVSKHFEDIKIKFIDDTDNHAQIIAEPFERGYAVTIGNALRRTLMTSVPGAAIVSIKIDGIDHEFSSIDGILEDVSDIILNLVVTISIFDLLCISILLFDKVTLFEYNFAGINMYFFSLIKNLYSLLSIKPL